MMMMMMMMMMMGIGGKGDGSIVSLTLHSPPLRAGGEPFRCSITCGGMRHYIKDTQTVFIIMMSKF